MDSAFGVIHSEVSKARVRRLSPAEQKLLAEKQARSAARGAKVGMTVRRIGQTPGKIANAKVSLNEIGRGVGTGTAAVGTGIGRALSAKPGLTGAAVIAGGAGGLYHAGRKPKNKVTVTKSAFEIEHTELSKAIRFPGIDTAKAAKLGLNKPKPKGKVNKALKPPRLLRPTATHSFNNSAFGITQNTDKGGSLFLKPKTKRVYTKDFGDKVATESTGGGLTNTGKVAVGSAAGGVGVAGYRHHKKK